MCHNQSYPSLIFYSPTNQHDEFNLHARSRARNIHHCRREKREEIKNKRKGEGSNQRMFSRTRRELIFSSTSFSVSNTSPCVFARHCFTSYCFTSLRVEKNIQRGNVIVTPWSPRKWPRHDEYEYTRFFDWFNDPLFIRYDVP